MNPEVAQPTLLAGAKAPEALVATILPGVSGLDLSTVTGVTFAVRNGTTQVVWSAEVVSKRADKLVARHVFDVDGVDTRVPGRYRIVPVLVIPGGVVRAKPFYLAVVP